MTDEEARRIGSYNAILRSVLDTATGIAHRSAEQFEGQAACLLFYNAGRAIARFMDESPELRALRDASIPPSFLGKAKIEGGE